MGKEKSLKLKINWRRERSQKRKRSGINRLIRWLTKFIRKSIPLGRILISNRKIIQVNSRSRMSSKKNNNRRRTRT
jgi:hypothetical protein